MANLSDITKSMNIEHVDNIGNKKKKDRKKMRTWLEDESCESVHLIDPFQIKNWEFSDRPENELGDIKSLANEFLKIGQQQPCVVRPTKMGAKFKYELIIGERRWRASIEAKTQLKAIIKDIDDNTSALCQAAENNNRKDLSDFAKSISYTKLIANGIVTRNDLVKQLGKSKQYISSLLSFSDIPESIISAIKDMSKVSYRSGETIKRLSNKGENYINALIDIADKIRTGEIGSKKIDAIVNKKINIKESDSHDNKRKIITKSGRHLYTWRFNDDNRSSIYFPKDISDLISSKKINLDSLDRVMHEILSAEISKLE
jgi:ParB family chromosome partitioning protein